MQNNNEVAPESTKGTGNRKERRQGRKVSDQSSSTTSPSKRKDSIPKKDKWVAYFGFIALL